MNALYYLICALVCSIFCCQPGEMVAQNSISTERILKHNSIDYFVRTQQNSTSNFTSEDSSVSGTKTIDDPHYSYLILFGSTLVIILLVLVVILLFFNQQRKRVGKLLFEKNRELEQLSLAISKTDNAILILDNQLRVEWANNALAELFGCVGGDADLIIGRPLSEVTSFSLLLNAVETCRTDKTTVAREYQWVTPTGKTPWLSSTLTPILDDQGELKKIMLVHTDITERKDMEENMRSAMESAEKAVAAKQEFLSNVSHEIRTPMNAIIGLTHVLSQESPRPEQAEKLEVVKFSADHLLALINDLLDYSKLEKGKMPLEAAPFDLRDLMKNLHKMFDNSSREKGLKLTVEADPELPYSLDGDSGKLYRVMVNLIGNAIKFTDKGFIKVSTRLYELKAGLATIEFSVTDSGRGIPAAKLETIFERFSQLKTNRGNTSPGTGLGLAITKKLLELFGCELSVESQVGKGSEFSFRLKLPVSPNPIREESEEVSVPLSPVVPLGELRVLLAEDNQVNLYVARNFLRQWGIDPVCVVDGVEAVEAFRDERFDLILMDLQMPRLNGYQASKAIRQADPQVPIIALSASADAEIQRKSRQMGMTDYIVKPYDPNDLYMKILQYASVRAGS